MTTNSTNDQNGCGCWLVIIIIVSAIIGYQTYTRNKQIAPFQNHLSEYAQLASSAARVLDNIPGGYIRDKLIVLDATGNSFDDIYFQLDEDLRAAQPQEVGTIVLVKRSEHQVGVYTDGCVAYVQKCTVTLIDKSISATVAVRDFQGSDPPSIKKNGGDRHGSFPSDEIVEYLAHLPRNPPLERDAENGISTADAEREARMVGEIAEEQMNQVRLEAQKRDAERQAGIEEAQRRETEIRKRLEAQKRDEEKQAILEESRAAELRRAKATEEAEQRATAARAADPKAYEIIDTKKERTRWRYRVRFLSDAASNLSDAELSEVAAALTQHEYYVVCFYLPNMDTKHKHWAESTHVPKGIIRSRILGNPPRR